MLLDYFGVLVRFVGKRTKNSKFWAMSRVLRSGEETPHSGEGLRNGEGPPRSSEVEKGDFSIPGFAAAKPLFTAWKIAVFRFWFVFCCSEDLSIGLMRIL